ncbi:hypothetical protein QBC35DRAFT_492038 [Podospora australis]|uniref:RRM domain-containing protein n=1 Tax=Podospora australis TaxID=1536484 RepID=A0AAN7AKY3_9PEZI|nr:hypothetical protein QBC35DRAFT_492038 [Podospora australis]
MIFLGSPPKNAAAEFQKISWSAEPPIVRSQWKYRDWFINTFGLVNTTTTDKMAPELRKRKSKTSVAEPEVAPVKKATKAPKGTPKAEKRKATEDASPVVIKKQKPVKETAASKKAEAPVEEEAAAKKAAPKKKEVTKKAEKAEKTEKATKKTKKAEEPVEQQNGDAEEEEVDDETNALIENLESDDDDAEMIDEASTYKENQDVGKIPKPKQSKKEKKDASGSDKPGVIYLARIPHGFYEHELRSYFGQFGEITKLRVVRNKKTGASRHRAFIEFADAEVADIAARTMDKYLLFGHILSAKVVPDAQVHPNLFKGANRRFKVIPWNKMAGKQLELPKSESQWQVRISKEEERRAKRAAKLAEMDYEFETPQLKAPEAKPQLENGTAEEEPKAIEAPVVEEKAEEETKEEAEPVAETKTKASKAKATKAAKVAEEAKEATPVKEKKSGKKAKKAKA